MIPTAAATITIPTIISIAPYSRTDGECGKVGTSGVADRSKGLRSRC